MVRKWNVCIYVHVLYTRVAETSLNQFLSVCPGRVFVRFPQVNGSTDYDETLFLCSIHARKGFKLTGTSVCNLKNSGGRSKLDFVRLWMWFVRFSRERTDYDVIFFALFYKNVIRVFNRLFWIFLLYFGKKRSRFKNQLQYGYVYNVLCAFKLFGKTEGKWSIVFLKQFVNIFLLNVWSVSWGNELPVS